LVSRGLVDVYNLEHKHEPSSPPHSPWWKFWKKS
ncbi:hypothetical protein ABFP36_25205, partial [Salmonella enterica subsp. enterica serovar Kentucky]